MILVMLSSPPESHLIIFYNILNSIPFNNIYNAESLIRFMEHTLSIPEGSYVSIDGKTLRSSGNKANGIDALHLLHAYSYECG